ncbi:uncharacterized protein FA14DRAFT_162862, partial [Meira miltonrushii]
MNVAAAIRIAAKIPTSSTVATIAGDIGLKYFFISLYNSKTSFDRIAFEQCRIEN